ncbi:hypothetical protein [Sulfurimonas sp.]|uniref:hypothetical protein n=1 Tax=Sulfurimonas sp. TaxID=2022749 RepID=UPI003563CD7F
MYLKSLIVNVSFITVAAFIFVGCSAKNLQFVKQPELGSSLTNKSRVIVTRSDGASGCDYIILDGNKRIGHINDSDGLLLWDREPGLLILRSEKQNDLCGGNSTSINYYLKPEEIYKIDFSVHKTLKGHGFKLLQGNVLTEQERELQKQQAVNEQRKKDLVEEQKKQKVIVNEFIEKKDFEKLKSYTDQNPNAVYYVKDESLRLVLTGPKGMKVGDIRKLIKEKESEVIIISLIKRVKTPYKEYTLDEIRTLKSFGLSDKIIATMIDVTTELLKDEQRRKEQEFFLSEQNRIMKENKQTKTIYQNVGAKQQKTVGDAVIDKATDAVIDKGINMLLDRLF